MMQVSAYRKYIYPACCVALLVYALFVLMVHQYDLLYTIHNFSVWEAQWSHPGGCREWVGQWMAQMCHYPWLGGMMLVLCWGASALLLIRAFALKGTWMLWAMIPLLALLASITDLGYWIFCLKTPSYWFGPTVGLLGMSLLLWLVSRPCVGFCSDNKVIGKTQWLTMALMMLVAYPLLGWYASLAALMMLLMPSWHRGVMGWVSLIVVGLVSAAFIGGLYLHSAHIFWREPLLWYGWHRIEIPEASSMLLEVPFWVLAIGVGLCPLVARLQEHRSLSVLPVVFALLCLGGSNMLNYRNVAFHTELKMLRALEEARWDDLLALMPKEKCTREMVLMKDVALAQQGKLGEKSFQYPVVGVRPKMNVDLPIHMAHSAAPYFYYWLGIPNYAFMWCEEDYIEYGLSPYFLKLMYRSTLAMGDEVTAKRFLTLLRRYPFYADYEVSEDETAAVRRFVTGHDQLTNDRGYCESFLLERLSQERYDTPLAQQIAVHWSILSRNRLRYERAIARYRELIGEDKPLPPCFSEQAAQWYNGQNTGNKTY